MNRSWLGTLVLVGAVGCASTPAPPELVAVTPARWPYRVPRAARAARRVTRTVPRVAGWSDARHLRAIDAFVSWDARPVRFLGPRATTLEAGRRPSDLVSFTPAGITVRGTPAQVDALARFLRDRADHRRGQVRVAVRLVRVARDRLPRLTRLEADRAGQVSTVVPRAQVEGRLQQVGRVVQAPSLVTLDASGTEVFVGEVLPVLRQRGEPAGRTERVTPGPRSGFSLYLTPALSSRGLALTLTAETSAALPAGSSWSLATRDAGHPRRSERLVVPRLRRVRAAGRFALRPGEAGLLAVDDPDSDEVLLLVLTWDRIPRAG